MCTPSNITFFNSVGFAFFHTSVCAISKIVTKREGIIKLKELSL